jgi:hypothetical protein
MIDVFTNLLTIFPDGPVLYSIEVLLAIVKLLAYTFECALPGIAAMGTETYVPNVLNGGKSDRNRDWYAASSSDYQPDSSVENGFLTGPFANAIVDRVFRNQDGDCANDLVVPQKGVYGANGHPLFPIVNSLILGPSDHVWHGGFFTRTDVLMHMSQHFEIPTETRIILEPIRKPTGRSGLRGIPPDSSSGLAGIKPGTRGGLGKETAGTTERRQVERHAKLDFPAVVRQNETRDLIISLSEFGDGVAEALLIPMERYETSVQLSVSVSANGFSVEPGKG